MRIIIASEMRVGSRWLHYLLSGILNMDVSPEVDGVRLPNYNFFIEHLLHEGRIAKVHHIEPLKLREYFPDVYIIGMVRNPRDVLISKAFHLRANSFTNENKIDTDFETIKFLSEQEYYWDEVYRGFKYMMKGCSTHDHNDELPYMWTSYEWMKEDTSREVESIINFLGLSISDRDAFNSVINMYSFKNLTTREPGEESRFNIYARKGIVGDWVNWLDDELIALTEDVYVKYNLILSTF